MARIARLHPLAGPFLIGLVLYTGLLSLLGGCGNMPVVEATPQTGDDAESLPHLIAVIEDRPGVRRAEMAPDGRFYFMSDDAISIIDGLTLVEQVFPPNLNEPYGQHLADMGIEPRSGLVYAIERYADLIHVISNTTLITTLSKITGIPLQIIVDEDSSEIYVFYVPDSNEKAESRVLILDKTHRITDIALPLLTMAARYNPVDGHIYVASNKFAPDVFYDNALTMLDNRQVITTIRPLDIPHLNVVDLAINPESGDVYILLTTRLVYWDRVHPPRSIDLDAAGYSNFGCLTVDPKTGWRYVCSWMSPTSYALVVDKDQLMAAIPIAKWPYAMTADAKHDYIYVAHYDPTYLSVIRGTELITKLDVIGFGAWDVVVDDAHDFVYVMNADDGSIDVFGFGVPVDKPSWFDYLPFIRR